MRARLDAVVVQLATRSSDEPGASDALRVERSIAIAVLTFLAALFRIVRSCSRECIDREANAMNSRALARVGQAIPFPAAGFGS